MLGACDIPTELPRFESRFVVPIDGTAVTVAELLPPAVTVSGDAFRLTMPIAGTQRTLGDMCEPCRAAHLAIVPKPAFTYSFGVATTLPADVASAVVTSGSVQVRVSHLFGFDPLRPEGRTENGTLTLTLRNGGRVLGSAVVDQPLPSGIELARTIAVAAGPVSGAIEVEATLVSPAGGTVVVNRDAPFRVDLVPGQQSVSEAGVIVTNRQVSVAPVQVDLTGMDEELRDRVVGGGLRIVMQNPFTVTGAVELRILVQENGTDLRRTLDVRPGSTSQRVDLTPQEIRALVGQRLFVSVTGAVDGGGEPVTVRPDMELRLDPRMELVLEIGA